MEVFDVLDVHFVGFHEGGDAFGEGAVGVWGVVGGFLEGIEEGGCAAEEAGVDGVVVVDLFADGSDFSVDGVDFGGIFHVKDLIEFEIDEQDGALVGWGCVGGAFDHFWFEDVIGHGEDEVAVDAGFGAEDADAVGFFEFRVELEGQFDGDILAVFAEGFFEDIGVIAGDDDDFFDAAVSEVLDIALDEAHATDEFKGFDVLGGFGESAAEASSEDDSLFWGI